MEENHRVQVGAYQDDSVGLSIWCMLNLLVGNLLHMKVCYLRDVRLLGWGKGRIRAPMDISGNLAPTL